MSLDVYLRLDGARRTGSGIFVRENGATRELTREEWDAKHPDQEPVVVNDDESSDVYQRNITHNLNAMAEAAGLYMYLWRPDEIEITIASQLIAPLTEGLQRLEAEPEKFKTFNPANGWGDYYGLCDFVRSYLSACVLNPDAAVSVSR